MFIWVDSELKNLYLIDDALTWAEQKNDIITKLLPSLYKLVNKRYSVSNKDLLKMLYGRWRSRHCVKNIEKQGAEKVKENKRRVAKNARLKDKKRRRTTAVDFLIRGNNKYISRYPEDDLVKILKSSGYHSEEWEETDPEDEWPIIQDKVTKKIREPINSEELDEDDPNSWVEKEIVTKEAVKKKTTSINIYGLWWHSPAVIYIYYYIIFYFIYL